MAEQIIHPLGEPEPKALIPYAEPVRVETFGGRIHVEWDPQASVTAMGQLPFFIEFLHISGLFGDWVAKRRTKLSRVLGKRALKSFHPR